MSRETDTTQLKAAAAPDALAAAINALKAATAEDDRLAALYDGKKNRAGHALWDEATGVVDDLTEALLSVETSSAADELRKQEAFRVIVGRQRGGELDETEARWALASALAALDRIAAWDALAAQMRVLHPDGAEAVREAQGRGLDPATFSGAVVDAPPNGGRAPVLFFGPWQDGGAYYIVQPGRVTCYTPVARGEGPPIPLTADGRLAHDTASLPER